MEYSTAKTVISFTVLLTAASCSEVICPSILESEADIDHLQSNMENRTYRLGEVVDYRCDAGYRILGKTWRECSGPSLDFPNQTWSDLNPVCSEVECPDPGDIQFGASRYLESTKVGGSVRFSCQSDYSLRGSAVRFCQPNGMWNGTLTTCDHERFFCPNPGIPIGGRLVNAHKMRFQEGEIVSYECKGDKVLIGSRQRECLKTRAWSGEPATCQGRYDFEDTREVAARFGREIEGIVADLQAPIIDHSPKSRRRRFIDPGYTQGMDIYFVFDASDSIPKAHFRYSLDLAKALVSKVGGVSGPRQARYAACVFASEAQALFYVSDPQPSVENVLTLIDGLTTFIPVQRIGRQTATGKALQLVDEFMIPAAHDKLNTRKYLFLFTDGKPNMGGDIVTARNAAANLRQHYRVQIHCIGIGEEIDRNELQDIASRPILEHLFFIRDYEELNLLAQILTQEIDYSLCGFNKRPTNLRTPRMVGGDYARSGDWPWQMALFCDQNIPRCDDSSLFCGGSIIARKWVLSAAHCMRECDVANIRVYTGIIDKSRDSLLGFNPALVYSLDGDDALILHEEFDVWNLDNNIALLRLSRSVTFSPNVRPICLPQPTMQDTELYSTIGAAYVVGWGSTDPYDLGWGCRDSAHRPTSPVLKHLAIPVRTDDECRESVRDHFRCSTATDYKPAMEFCAGYSEGNLDTCRGDSGGPIMRLLTVADGTKRWVQIGIVSWGEGCAVDGRYSIYTRLSTYTSWIQDHIDDTDHECPEIRMARLDPALTVEMDGGNSQGSVVEFACRRGFWPLGETTLTCQDGSWSHPFPTCEMLVDAPESSECNCEVWQKCVATNRDGELTCRCIHPQHCDDVMGREQCGSDGRTYASMCRLKATACLLDLDIWVVNQGPCPEGFNDVDGFNTLLRPETCNCEVWERCVVQSYNQWTCNCIHPRQCNDSTSQQKYCGSDGITYASICRLKATACLLDLNIQVASQGPCPERGLVLDESSYESPESSSTDPESTILTNVTDSEGQDNQDVPTPDETTQASSGNYLACGYNNDTTRQTWGRISGGDYAEEGKWPWQVALFCRSCTGCLPTFFCGGSLIASNWVLSAAHCFTDCPASRIRLYTGFIDKSRQSLQLFDPALVYTLDGDDALIRHEAFNPVNLDNDIALLRLSCNVKLSSKIRPICMPQLAAKARTLYSPKGEPTFVAGWGTTRPYDYGNLCIEGYRTTSSRLRHVVVPVRTHEECRQSFLHHFQCATVLDYKPDIAFCAGVPEGGSDACNGDSGGPVMRQLTVADGTRRWVQIGIVSWGEGCAVEGRYGIYTRLSAYTHWIQAHVGA